MSGEIPHRMLGRTGLTITALAFGGHPPKKTLPL
jgi:hypothetical protein